MNKSSAFLFLAVGVLLGMGLLSGCSLGGLFGSAGTPTPTSTPIPTETPGPSPTPDAVRPDDIVYVRRYVYGLSGDLYLVHTNGLAARQITSFTRDQPSAGSDYPVWSPDHKQAAYSSEYRDLYNLAVWNIYRIDPYGIGSQQVTGLPQPNNGYFPNLESNIPGVPRDALLTPPPGLRVHGRVLAGGKPVAGAVVISWLGRGFTRTDAGGNYVLENVPSGRGWIKATAAAGSGWSWVDPLGSDTTAPDITLDPSLGNAEYDWPTWDPRGGFWGLYSQHWFDPATHGPLYETRLVHMGLDGSGLLDTYTAADKTMGPPRPNPANPAQIAVTDGTELVLLTTDISPQASNHVPGREVLHRNLLRNGPIAWSPDGAKLCFLQTDPKDSSVADLIELVRASGATRQIMSFTPDQMTNSGFDLSPDGTEVVYEHKGDLYILPIDAPAGTKPRHITYFGQASHPTWGGH